VRRGPELKTNTDLIAHEKLSIALTKLEKSIPIISEEDHRSLIDPRPSHYWIIDPIDGTASFINGYSGYVVQVALIEDKQPVLAAIYAPSLRQMYLAKHKQGATMNGNPICISKNKRRRILIDNYPSPKDKVFHVYNELKCTGYLESGSISLKICRVADGSADIFFKGVSVRDWDIAAPHLILEEAGGVLTLPNGETYNYWGPYEKKGILATNSPVLADKFHHWFTEQEIVD